MFKEKCIEFLDGIVAKRNEEIAKAVSRAIETDFVPYAENLNSVKKEMVAKELEKKQKLIATIEADYQRKVANYNLETDKAIANKKAEVVANAENIAKANYDRFIAEFTSIAEKTNID